MHETGGFVSVCCTCSSFLQPINTPHHTNTTYLPPAPLAVSGSRCLRSSRGLPPLSSRRRVRSAIYRVQVGREREMYMCVCVCIQVYVDNPDLLLVCDRHEEAVLEVPAHNKWR